MGHFLKIRNFHSRLVTDLSASIREGYFSPEAFFQQWFENHGCGFYFLFTKNLKVTNIQFGELLALIRVFTKTIADYPKPNLHFINRNEFLSSIRDIPGCFENPDAPQAHWPFVARTYSDLFYRMVVVQPFHGSCAVFLPFHLDLDLLRIAHYAGYIHSCGRLVYQCPVNSAQQSEFFNALERHLQEYPPRTKPNRLFFTVYAHEDFSEHDEQHRSDLRHGLDSVKLLVERFYMGESRLIDVIGDLQEEMRDVIEVAHPSSYREDRGAFQKSPRADNERTLWLLIDRGIDERAGIATKERFYICYDQTYIAECPFRFFNEEKPAWVAPTTIPDSLAAAMINISAPYWKEERPIRLCDPFVGCGTIWFTAHRWPDIEAHGSDINSITKQLINDNLAFVSMSASNLRKYIKKIDILLAKSPGVMTPRGVNDPTAGRLDSEYQWAIAFHDKTADSSHIGVVLDNNSVKEFGKVTRFARLLYYISLRVAFRNASALKRHKISWWPLFAHELKLLKTRLKTVIRLKGRSEKELETYDGLAIFNGRYSRGVTMSRCAFDRMKQMEAEHVMIKDATILQRRFFDLIVTDPPYGFNTEEEARDLALLYQRFFRRAVQALRDGGQLVVALPEQSFTGRLSPPFTHEEIVVQQLLSEADRQGRYAFVEATALPGSGSLFRPPYYWEAERTLRRRILHFRFENGRKNAPGNRE